MKKILLSIFLLALTLLKAYEITSIELSDIAVEYPKEQRVELGAVTDRFPVDTSTIHALIHLKDVGENDPVTVRWVSIDALPKPNTELGEASGTLDPHTKIFHVYYDNRDLRLPAGRYALEILSDGALKAKKEFSLVSQKRDGKENENIHSVFGVSEIYLAKDVKENSDGTVTPIGVGEYFPNSQHKIYVIVPYKGLKAGTPYSLEWVVVNDGINRNKSLYKMKGILKNPDGQNEGTVTANIHLPRDWPDGIFEVIFRLDGKIVARKRFTIGDVSKLKEKSIPSKREGMGRDLQKTLISRLSGWMLSSIERKDLTPLYEHSVHSWRDHNDWQVLKQGFQGIFNAGLKWKEIFAQTPKILPPIRLENGAIRLQVIYPGIDSVDVLLSGTFLQEDGEWRLLGFELEPVNQ